MTDFFMFVNKKTKLIKLDLFLSRYSIGYLDSLTDII